MSTGKTFSTKYLLDSNDSKGVEGQVLSTTSSGIDWVDANTLPGTGIWLENGNDIYNNNTGNVGIGTTSPTKKLDVRGNIYVEEAFPSITFKRNTSGLQEYRIINEGNFTIEKTTLDFGGSFIIQDENGRTPLNVSMDLVSPDIIISGDLFVKDKDGTTTNLYVDNGSGNVGINTTSPAGILHTYSTSAPVIESPSNAAMIIRRNDNNAYSSLLKYHSGNSEKFVVGLSDSGDFTDSTGEEYFIGTTKTNPLLVLKNNGNVGIGTTSPSAKLHTKGSTSTALTGTVSVTAASTAVVGIGTLFTTELSVGAAIKIGTEIFTVSVITDALNLTLDSAHAAGASGVTAYKDSDLFSVDNGDAVNQLLIDSTGNITSQGYSSTGTRAGGDLVVSIGDYDASGDGFSVVIDDSDQSILFTTTGAIESKFLFSATQDRDYTFPNLDGTIALEGQTEWYQATGTSVGGDLLVTIGDYDEVYTGTKFIVDIDKEEASMSGNGFVAPRFSIDNNTFRGGISAVLTATRSYLLPDASGTIALEGQTEWYQATGTAAGGDLIVAIGDYADADVGLKLKVDNANDQILLGDTDGADQGFYWRFSADTLIQSSVGNAYDSLNISPVNIVARASGTTSVTLDLNASGQTGDNTISLPDASGTVALTSDAETNAVQTVTGATSAASIGADVNVVYSDSSVALTLTIETTTNIALIELINNGSANLQVAAGTGVTVTQLDSFVGVSNVGRLIKISANNWVFTAL